MKRFVILILSLFDVFLLSPQSNSHFPLKPTLEWRVNYTIMYNNTTNMEGDEVYKFFISGDTVINSIQYYKLYKSGIAYYDTPFYFENVYIGALRDNNNKFYFVEKNESSEEFLYDFDLKAGETVESTVEYGMEVVSVEILDNGRKKINLNKTRFPHGECMNWNNAYFIEGIGSMGGIFYPTPCNHIGYTEHYLVCYSEDGIMVYQSSLSPVNCNTVSDISSHVNSSSNIVFYPNPAVRTITIEFLKPIVNNSILDIYDITGSLVSSEIVEPNSNKVEVSLPELKRGIYFIKFFNHDFSSINKIIIE